MNERKTSSTRLLVIIGNDGKFGEFAEARKIGYVEE